MTRGCELTVRVDRVVLKNNLAEHAETRGREDRKKGERVLKVMEVARNRKHNSGLRHHVITPAGHPCWASEFSRAPPQAHSH
jgi:hypothetical protein